MAASFTESRRKRWQMEAKQAHGRDLPPWTRSDEDEDADDHGALRKRRVLRRRSDEQPNTGPNVKVSLVYPPRRPRDFELPGNSFRETYDINRRSKYDEEYDIPGNSLRESSIDTEPTETAKATTEAAQRTTTKTVEATTSVAAKPYGTVVSMTTTSSRAPSSHATHGAAYDSASSDSDSAGGESASDGEDEDMATGDAVASAAPAVTSSLPSNQNLMVEDSNLHSNVHKILLSVGCVVAFILIASVLLIAWKLRKRNRHRKPAPLDDTTFQKPSRIDRILAKAPFIRRHMTSRHEWYTIPDPSRVTLEKSKATPDSKFTTRRIDSSVFSFDKPVGLGLYGADFSQSVSTIDTQFVAPGKPTGVYTGTLPRAQSTSRPTPEPVSPLYEAPRPTTSRSRVTSLAVSPQAYDLSRPQSSRSRANSVAVSPVSTMFVEDTAVQVQVVSRQAPKAIRLSGGKKEPEDIPPMPTPKWDFSHLKRQTGASDLSSISSGFGDGDIIITPNNTVATVNTTRLPTPPSPVAGISRDSTLRSTRAAGSRQSSLRNAMTASPRDSSLGSDSRRDTVSTQVSIESRPRFHSVGSWVKQQSGQVRKAQQQHSGDTPPVPMLPPPEQELRYMMPDGEEPRRPEVV